jgi:hypothetical protein
LAFFKSLTSEYKENNLVLFTFEDDADLSRVLDNSPWNIKGSPLFLQRWENDDTFEDLDFSKGAFWIHVHGLPLEWMTTENASSIGNSLGVLLEVNNADKLRPNRKGFLRIRALINLKEPLATGFLHHRPPKALAKIQYQYERLSNFCYACGRLGHLSFACPIVPQPPDIGIYGVHLKASSPKVSRVEVTIPVRCSQASQASSGMVVLTQPSPGSTRAGSSSSPPQLNLSSTVSVLSCPISTKSAVSCIETPLVRDSKSDISSALNVKSPNVNLQLVPLTSLMLSQVANIKTLQLNLSEKTWPSFLKSSTLSVPTCTPPIISTENELASILSPSIAISSTVKPPRHPPPLQKKRFHPYPKSSISDPSSPKSKHHLPKKPKIHASSLPDEDSQVLAFAPVTTIGSLFTRVADFSLPPPIP